MSQPGKWKTVNMTLVVNNIPRVVYYINCSYCIMYFYHRQVSSNDYSSLDSLTKSIVKGKQPFIRLEMKKEDLLEMFKVQS